MLRSKHSLVRRNIHVGTVKGGNRRAPKKLKGPLEIGPQDLQRPRNAGLPCGSQAVGVRPAHQDRPGTETEGLYDVAPAAYASIQENLGSAIHGCDNFRQDSQGSRRAVELAPAVI